MPVRQINPEARKSIKLIDDYNNNSRQKFIKRIAEDEDFRLGKQWTDDEVNELKERAQFPLVVHRILPVIEQKKAQLNSKNPTYRCVPAGDGDVKVASVINHLFTYIWNLSRGRMVLRLAIDHMLAKGLGYLYTYTDKYADYGRGEVKIDYLNPEDVFVDPESRKPDFGDAENIVIYKEFSKSQVKSLKPEWTDDFIESIPTLANGQYQFKTDLNADYVDVIQPADMTSIVKKYGWYERYSKKKMVYYLFKGENGLETISEEEYSKQKDILGPDEQRLFESQVSKIFLDRVELTITCETELVLKTVLPISHYPIVPIVNFYTGTPYPMGDVRILKDMQRETNKRRSLMIAHAAVSTNPRLMLERGSLGEDEDDIETRWARPNAVILYNPGTTPPQTHSPLALPTALYQLEQEAKYDIEYTAGIFGLSMGDPAQSPETFRGTMAIEEFGNRRIQLAAQTINEALAQLGRVMVELIQANYTLEKTIRIVQDDGEQIEFTINQTVEDKSGVAQKVNDITTGQYDVYFVAGSTMASNRWAMLDEMVKLYQLGIVDDVEVLKKTEVFDTEGVMKRKSMLAQTMNQNKEFQQAIKDLMSQVESLRKKNITLEKEMVIKDFKLDLQRELDELGLQATAQKKMRELEKKELQLKKQQANANLKAKSSNK